MLSRRRAIALVRHSYLYYVGYDISRPQDVKTLRWFCRASENRALQRTAHEPIPTLIDNDWARILDAPMPFRPSTSILVNTAAGARLRGYTAQRSKVEGTLKKALHSLKKPP
jgi:hypothetical protein